MRLVVENLRIKAKGPRSEPTSQPEGVGSTADLDEDIPF